MSDYRYVIFPRGRQPAVGEVQQLQAFAGALANHFAWGTCRDDGRLAIVFEARGFDHLKASNAGFDALLERWTLHGCETVDHLKFVKDAAALKPVAAAPKPVAAAAPRATPPQPGAQQHVPSEKIHGAIRDAAKELVAHEATARSLLSFDRTMQRIAAAQRFAAAGPYLLMAIAAALIIALGLTIRHRLIDSSPERRQDAIQRMTDQSAPGADESDASK